MTASRTETNRAYHQEDIQQILQLAIAHQSHQGEFSYQQLLEIAAELDIPAIEIQAAEQEWLIQQGNLKQHQAFRAYRWGRLKRNLGRFLIFNTFFLAINWLSAGTLTWSLYILLFWGFGLSLGTWNTYQLSGEAYDRAFQKWHRRYQVRRWFNSFLGRWLSA